MTSLTPNLPLEMSVMYLKAIKEITYQDQYNFWNFKSFSQGYNINKRLG